MAFEAAYEAQSGMGEERVVYFRESAARTYGPGEGRGAAAGPPAAYRRSAPAPHLAACPACMPSAWRDGRGTPFAPPPTSGPYLAAQALAEAPFLLPQAAAYTLLLYFLLGMRASLAGVAFAYLVVLTSAAAMILLAQVQGARAGAAAAGLCGLAGAIAGGAGRAAERLPN
jgi:hypothetical protein